MLALGKFADVFDHIQPYQQKELIRLVLHKAILGPDSMKVALYVRPPGIGTLPLDTSERLTQTSTWLPGLGSKRLKGNRVNNFYLDLTGVIEYHLAYGV